MTYSNYVTLRSELRAVRAYYHNENNIQGLWTLTIDRGQLCMGALRRLGLLFVRLLAVSVHLAAMAASLPNSFSQESAGTHRSSSARQREVVGSAAGPE